MADYAPFGHSNLLIELDKKQAGAKDYRADFGASLTALVTAVADQVNAMPADRRPSELTIELSLRALGNGGYAIVADSTHANFRITAKFGGDNANPLSGLVQALPIP